MITTRSGHNECTQVSNIKSKDCSQLTNLIDVFVRTLSTKRKITRQLKFQPQGARSSFRPGRTQGSKEIESTNSASTADNTRNNYKKARL